MVALFKQHLERKPSNVHLDVLQLPISNLTPRKVMKFKTTARRPGNPFGRLLRELRNGDFDRYDYIILFFNSIAPHLSLEKMVLVMKSLYLMLLNRGRFRRWVDVSKVLICLPYPCLGNAMHLMTPASTSSPVNMWTSLSAKLSGLLSGYRVPHLSFYPALDPSKHLTPNLRHFTEEAACVIQKFTYELCQRYTQARASLMICVFPAEDRRLLEYDQELESINTLTFVQLFHQFRSHGAQPCTPQLHCRVCEDLAMNLYSADLSSAPPPSDA